MSAQALRAAAIDGSVDPAASRGARPHVARIVPVFRSDPDHIALATRKSAAPVPRAALLSHLQPAPSPATSSRYWRSAAR
jgi:hypothetical protein